MIKGTIIKGIGGFYYVRTDDGRVAECRARGKLRKNGITPMVGDLADICVVNENPYEGAIENINERKNYLVRPPVANIDCIAIVVAATSPAPDKFLIDKLLVSAESFGIEAFIVINKIDLDDGNDIETIYKSCGYDVYKVCAAEGKGIEQLKERVKGKITAFAGNSGVGKSSILRHFGFDVETGGVSKIERGKHTTRHVELFALDNGYVMDTPGFSLLEVNNIKADELKVCFSEFLQFNDSCRFAGCNHYGAKASDCAIVEAVEDGIIPESRYENYKALFGVLKEIKDYD